LCIPGRCKELGPDAAQQAAAEATARLAAAVLEELPETDQLSRALALRWSSCPAAAARQPSRRYGRWGSWSATSVMGRNPHPLAPTFATGADGTAGPVRRFTPEGWAEPDDYELQMTAGLADHCLTPRLAEARRWHAPRRWCEAMNAWSRAHPEADRRFEELLERRTQRLASG
jgi:hypothetical protein